MNKNKGFTLIELIAVIIVLALLALITVPAISGVISNAKRKTAEHSVELFVKSFQTAVSNSSLDETVIESGTFTTTDGHTFINSVSGETFNVAYNGNTVICNDIMLFGDGNVYLNNCSVGDYVLENYTYGRKQICTPASESENGNVPEGNYNYGDEYICNVDGTNYYTFYVLEDGDKDTELEKGTTGTAGSGEVALIMSDAIGDEVSWCESSSRNVCSQYIQKGRLEEIIDNWGEINILGYQISLPTKEQLEAVIDETNPWLINNIWASTPGVNVDEGFTYIYEIVDSSDLISHYCVGGVCSEVPTEERVCPVITISKDFIY